MFKNMGFEDFLTYVWGFVLNLSNKCTIYRGADKSLARPGRNKPQRQKILCFIYPMYNHNLRNISTIYITRLASNQIFSPSNKIHREVDRVKHLSASLNNYLLIFTVHLLGKNNEILKNAGYIHQDTSGVCQRKWAVTAKCLFARTSMVTLYLHQCRMNINGKITLQLTSKIHFKRLHNIHFFQVWSLQQSYNKKHILICRLLT